MVVSVKDSFKLFGISIMTLCAVTVCNLFLNYYIDLAAAEGQIAGEYARLFYEAQLMTAKVVCCLSGGCLAATTVVMLFFYIRHYIASHARQLGILKALGYSDFRIAKGFSAFGLSAFAGCLAGYLLSFALMPGFYEKQNEEGLLPDISVKLHGVLFALLVILPTIVFALIAVINSLVKLHKPCVNLLKGTSESKIKNVSGKDKKTFVGDMKSAVLRSRKTLVFFIAFSAFCFSAMVQMSSRMRELASDMMGVMIFLIGIVLAFTTLYIAVTTVVAANRKNVAMMRAFGYSAFACKRSVLDGYRPAAYIGFLIGTVYQYVLLKVMVEIVFADIDGVPPSFDFDFPAFFITLVAFILVYEGVMLLYARGMKRISLKEIMSE